MKFVEYYDWRRIKGTRAVPAGYRTLWTWESFNKDEDKQPTKLLPTTNYPVPFALALSLKEKELLNPMKFHQTESYTITPPSPP